MQPSDAEGGSARIDVCLVLEGTYPYVRGGVSSWVHDLIRSLPDLRFALVHIGPERGTYTEKRYALPDNVAALSDLYCREALPRGHDEAALHRAARAEHRRHAGGGSSSRVLGAFRRLHTEEQVDASLLADLASGDLPVGAFLHGRPSFDMTVDLCERLAPEASFLDFFWHFRSMHLPLVRLLSAKPPAAATYHALCTGYAGLLAAVWSHRTGRPLLITEHGIYTRERSMELDRAPWFREPRKDRRSATSSALRRMWMHFFGALARCVYARASLIISLSEVARKRQISDGAPPEKTRVVPNGVDLEGLSRLIDGVPLRFAPHLPVRVGFVGRIVPIKDVVTFIRACSLALGVVDLDVRIFGPIDEDAAYVRRCRRLLAKLGLERAIRFEGPQPIERIYSEIDLLVLTSFSEGQPLVILEANAVGIPVIASDVGACRELIEGRGDADRRLGPSGIVTRIAAPEETSAAIARLARDPELRCRMGDAGRRRVRKFYRQSAIVESYRALYAGGPWLESAGASSA